MAEAKDTDVSLDQEPNPASPDWYLQTLVQVANESDATFPVTLYVNGLLVSGILIGGHKFFTELGVQFTQFFGGESEETTEIVGSLTSPGEIYYRDGNSDTPPPPQYVHLKEARVFSPGQQPIPANGSLWRGRLASVDGFSLGCFALDNPA